MVSVKPISKKSKEKSDKLKTKKNISKVNSKMNDNKILDSLNENTIKKITTEKENLKKVKYVMPSKYITEELVSSSLNALQKLSVIHAKKNIIFGSESSIFLEIRCMKIPHAKGNVTFVLPHSTAASTGEICLITPDLKKGQKHDHEPTVEHWKDILQESGISEIKTVLPLRQLRVEYDQYELKRRLLTQHDLIMVDTRVLNHASSLLGKMFFKKHNMVIPVKIYEKRFLKKNIEKGIRTVMLRLNEGHTSTILVGHTNMAHNYLKENILSLVNQLSKKYPGGEANIRSLSLKLPLSLSLPLYLTLRSANTIQQPKLVHKKPKHFTLLEDELSTIPNSIVRVAPDGTVHVKKLGKKAESKDDIEYEENASTAEMSDN